MSEQGARIVVFACNWDGLSCVEAAATEGHCYPASARVVRVTCLSRINQGVILKAFELGADGVMLLGCEPGNCQFDIDSRLISEEFDKAQMILGLLGLGEDRLVLAHMSRGDGYTFVRKLTDFVAKVSQIRPVAAHAKA
jgi:coenzyme F420-reducing hydrogenase delta subunit